MKTCTKFFLWCCILLLTQQLQAQPAKKCPPIPMPVLHYQYQGQLRSAIGAELNLWFCPKKCDCNSSLGFVCYLYGPTAGINLNYYPSAKTWDVSASFGYRSIGIPFLKPEITAGYSFAGSSSQKNNTAIFPVNFFHVDPAIGFDLGVANIAFGYSFRSVKIEDRSGGFIFRLGISPALFFADSKPNRALGANTKTARTELRKWRRG